MPKELKDSNLFPVSRERLYQEVWSTPMLKLAKRYGVSSSYLARVCTRMNVPRPERGYWAKLKHGKTVEKPPLPKYSFEYQHEWIKGSTAVGPTSPPLPRAPKKKSLKTSSSKKLPKTHPLIAGAKVHFLKSRKPGEFSNEKDNYYLRPYKKMLVDLVVSKNSLDDGLEIMNQILNAFVKSGYRTVIASYASGLRRYDVDVRENPGKSQDYDSYWSPNRITAMYIDDIAIGLTLFETSEKVEISHPWGTSNRYLPSQRFVLQSYSPYSGTEWVKRWKINKNKSITRQGEKIARELYKSTAEIWHQYEDARRMAEQQKKKWKEDRLKRKLEEEKSNREKSLQQSNELLQQVIKNWAFAKSIEAFFDEVAEKISTDNPSNREEINNRLTLAKEVFSKVNALEYFTEWKSPDEIYTSLRKVWS